MLTEPRAIPVQDKTCYETTVLSVDGAVDRPTLEHAARRAEALAQTFAAQYPHHGKLRVTVRFEVSGRVIQVPEDLAPGARTYLETRLAPDVIDAIDPPALVIYEDIFRRWAP